MWFESEISGIGELIHKLGQLGVRDITWFRGQGDKSWGLVPGLGRRADGISAEMAIIKRFKQNAGPYIPTKDAFFGKKLPYPNTRYRHYDLATKFLYIEHHRKFSDTKKVYLDDFVKDYRGETEARAQRIAGRVRPILADMSLVFLNSDKLLASVGMTVLYYLLFREARGKGWTSQITRHRLLEFDELRLQNRKAAEQDIAKADYDLLEFDRYSQAPNDALAVNFRYKVLRRHVGSV